MNQRSVDLRRFGELRRETVDLGRAFRDSAARTTELGARLASTRNAARHFIRANGGEPARRGRQAGKNGPVPLA